MLAAESANQINYVLDEPARILVVDDDPIILEFARVYLSTPVVEIQTALGGAAALEALTTERFDLALVDLEMPGMSGFELIDRVRSVQRLAILPIMVVTGREDVASIDQAFLAGATSFVTKPINWRLLSYQIRYVLRSQRCLMCCVKENASAACEGVEQGFRNPSNCERRRQALRAFAPALA